MLAWDDSEHALGVDDMDATHREFAALVNRLAASADADFPALFEQLVEHCGRHFTHEGSLMRISRFPALNEHEGEHHRIFGDLVQMRRAVQRGRLMLPRAFVKQGLQDWFLLHLNTMDAALAAHLKRVGESRVTLSGGLPVLM